MDYVKPAALDAPGLMLFAILPADARTAAKLPRPSQPQPAEPPAVQGRAGVAVGRSG